MLTYTEPDLERVSLEAEQLGMVRAWGAAKKLQEIDIDTLHEIFGWVAGKKDVFIEYTASEAIEKLKAYERDSEIKVGDEVQFKNTGSKFVITRIFASEVGRKCEGLFDDGEVYESVLDGGNVEKTGRTFPEIAAVLEKMRGEQDGET